MLEYSVVGKKQNGVESPFLLLSEEHCWLQCDERSDEEPREKIQCVDTKSEATVLLQ